MRLDAVQHRVAGFVNTLVQETKELPLNIGSIQVQHLNKVVLKEIFITDEKGDTALSIPKITAHLSPLHLLKGDIKINTLMIGCPNLILNREREGAPLNIQFILDKLASDSTKESKSLPDIRINHIQIYDGVVRYDIIEHKEKGDIFDPSHIAIEDLVCNLSLKKLNSDTLSLYIRSVSGRESSGFELERLSAKINATPKKIGISDFLISLPHSKIKSKSIELKNIDSDKFQIKGEINGERISLCDLAAFMPQLRNNLPELRFRLKAEGNEKRGNGYITLSTNDNSLIVKTEAATTNILKKNKTLSFNITESKITDKGIGHLQTIVCDSTGNLDILKTFGNIYITGNANIVKEKFSSNIIASTDNGEISGDFAIDEVQNFSTALTVKEIDLGRTLENKDFGLCNVDVAIAGTIKDKEPIGSMSSKINSLHYKDYEYSLITIDGGFSGQSAEISLNSYDKNASAKIDVSYNRKEITLKAHIDSVKPHNLNLSKDGKGSLSAIIEGKYISHREKKSLLDVRAYNITYETDDEKESIRNLHFTDNNLSDIRYLLISSDFMDVNVTGVFDYSTLAGTFNNILHTHLPAIAPRHVSTTNNFYSFKFNIKDTKSFSSLLGLPITIHTSSTIVGQCDDNRKLFYADIRLNNADINGRPYRSIDAKAIANDQSIILDAEVQSPLKIGKNVFYDEPEKDTKIDIDITGATNNISSQITWTSNETDNGTFKAKTTLQRNELGDIETITCIEPSNITYHNNLWELNKCNITGNGRSYNINNFALRGKEKFINIHGTIGESNYDQLAINLKSIQLEDIFDIINFRSVEFGGNATGKVELSGLLSTPQFSSNLNVKNFTFEKGFMGELDFEGKWDNERKAILINGDIYDIDNAHTVVTGFVSPANDTINLCIDADRTRVEFLNSMLEGIVSEVKGNVSGQVYVIGSLSKPNLVGEAEVYGGLKLVTTNTRYTMAGDIVKMVPNKISFDRFTINDIYGNKGFLSGDINHNAFSDWTCNLRVEANNLLAYHTTRFGEYPFYGTAFTTGDVSITADDRGIFLHANVRSDAGSTFVYDAGTTGSVTSNSFITFTDRNKRKSTTEENKEKRKSNTLLSRLNLEFMLDITQDMQLKVFTNVKTGDYIDIYGNGPIIAVYDEKAGFSMKGNLDIERGTYKFTMQDIFPKEFDITKGSTLTFDGDPFLAELNLKTKYLVPSASLSDLDPDGKRHKNVKVNCLMDITGKLESPQLNFDIELPDANEEEKELLASAINTPEQKNTQFIYLMGIGKFYTYDYNRNTGGTQSSTAMESLISNTISGQLNNMLSQIIDNRNWNISGNFSSSERGWNSMEVEGILEGRLLNNRLLINGNFGYRENPMANTNFVGDFEVQWLLDKNGKVSLKAYSKTNDRYFSEATLTTQGAGIILRHDFNDWRWWLKNNKNRKKETDIEK